MWSSIVPSVWSRLFIVPSHVWSDSPIVPSFHVRCLPQLPLTSLVAYMPTLLHYLISSLYRPFVMTFVVRSNGSSYSQPRRRMNQRSRSGPSPGIVRIVRNHCQRPSAQRRVTITNTYSRSNSSRAKRDPAPSQRMLVAPPKHVLARCCEPWPRRWTGLRADLHDARAELPCSRPPGSLTLHQRTYQGIPWVAHLVSDLGASSQSRWHWLVGRLVRLCLAPRRLQLCTSFLTGRSRRSQASDMR